MWKLKNNKLFLFSLIQAFLFCAFVQGEAWQAPPTKKEYVTTDAGNFDFSFLSRINFSGVFHHITNYHAEETSIELDDGSMWMVSKPSVIQTWRKEDNIVVTQNHLTFSTYRFCLLNIDQKLAVPVSLAREPIPNSVKHTYFIKKIDHDKGYITTTNNQDWHVYLPDLGTLPKLHDHDRVIVGINAMDSNAECPYILLDTAANTYVRASLVK